MAIVIEPRSSPLRMAVVLAGFTLACDRRLRSCRRPFICWQVRCYVLSSLAPVHVLGLPGRGPAGVELAS